MGDGIFPFSRKFAVGVSPWSIALGDVNGDGNPDIVTANYGSNDVSVLLNKTVIAFPRIIDHTPGGVVTGSVDSICLSFDRPMDPSSFSLDQDIISFTGPQGPIVPTGFTWISSKTLEVTFEPLTSTGEYRIVIGPQILDPVGNALDQDGDLVTGEVPDDQYTVSFTIKGPRIIDHTPGGVVTGSVDSICLNFDRPMDPSSFSFAQDILSFTGPQGAIVPTGYNWIDGQTLEVTFKPLTSTGEYRMVIGPQILDPIGNALDQDRDLVTGEVPDDQYTVSFTIRGPRIIDHTPGGVVTGPVDSLCLSFDQPMDQSSFSFAQDIFSFAGPRGAVVPTGYNWIDAQTLEVTFEPLTSTGEYRMVIGPQILNLTGNALDQDRDLATGEVPDDCYQVTVTIDAPRVLGHTPSNALPGNFNAIQFDFNRPMDQTSFAIADDIISFIGPNGPVTANSYYWVDSDTLEVSFAPQSRLGTYTMVIGPQIMSPAGNALDQDCDLITGEVPDDRYQATVIVGYSGTITKDTVWNPEVGPFIVSGLITIAEDVTLTINAGTIVKFTGASTGIAVKGVLDINGTVENPVILTSNRDDTAGGDTNGDGAATVPAANDWFGVSFASSSARGDLTGVQVRYANGAITVQSGAHVALQHLVLTNNLVGIRGWSAFSQVEVENSLLTNNSSAVNFSDTVGAALRNTTIVGNQTAGQIIRPILDIENCIFAFNAGGFSGSQNPGDVTARNSVFYQSGESTMRGWLGDQVFSDNKNINADPLFVDRATGNYELGAGSPAIDAGRGIGAPLTDFLGRSRYDDLGMPNLGYGFPSYVDIGAFERQQNTASPDLAVTYVCDPIPEFVSAGDSFTVEWAVTNVGLIDASGPWKDVVYLSMDPYLSADDQVLERRIYDGTLSPGDSYTETLTAIAPSIPGPYYVLVRTNAEHSFTEPVETDNILASSGVLAVDLPVLAIGSQASGTIFQGQWTYLRFDAGAGNTVILHLDAASQSGSTALYVRYETPPTFDQYDTHAAVLNNPDQQLRIPSPIEGTYYVGIYGTYVPGGSTNFTLTAAQTPLDIRVVSPDRVGNAGKATIRIEGDSFSENAQAQLIGPNGKTIEGVEYYQDPTTLFATFDLASAGASPGAYDVMVINIGSDSTIGQDAVTILSGGTPQFEAKMILPGFSRPNRWVDVEVQYANLGTNDIASPILTLTSDRDVNWMFPGSDEVFSEDTLRFLALSSTGPAGVLRPGQRETITLRMQTPFAREPVNLSLGSSGAPDRTASDQVIDWSQFESSVRLPFQPDEEWNVFWTTFTNRVGHTWREVASVLADNATAEAAEGTLDYSYDHHVLGLMSEVFAGGGGLLDTTGPWVTDHQTGRSQLGGGIDYVLVTFSEQVSEDSFTAADVQMTGPNGPIQVTEVALVSQPVWRIKFAPQTTAGEYHVLVGPQIIDEVGTFMDQDHDGKFGESADDVYDASFWVTGGGGSATDLYITGHSPHGNQRDSVSFVEVYFNQPVLYGSFTSGDAAMVGPNGPIAITGVSRINSSVYRVEFQQQDEPGIYTVLIGPQINDLRGLPMNQDLDSTRGESIDDRYVASFQIVDSEGPYVVSQSPTGDQRPSVSAVELTFDEDITPGSFTTADVSLIGPRGSIGLTGVAPIASNRFRFTFESQLEEGDYIFTVGPNITDLTGNPMNQDGDDTNGEAYDAYMGWFTILPPDAMIIQGTVLYNGEPAHVRIQLWEENGGSQDEEPGAGDDVLLNEMKTKPGGAFYFSEDSEGNRIRNEDPVDGGKRDLYFVVFAENYYAKVIMPGTVNTTHGSSVEGWTSLTPNIIWAKLYSRSTLTLYNVPGNNPELIDLDLYGSGGTTWAPATGETIKAFGVGNEIWKAGDWLYRESGNKFHRDVVPVAYPYDDWHYFIMEEDDYLVNGHKVYDLIVVDPGVTDKDKDPADITCVLAHEYGHAVHYAIRGGSMPEGAQPKGEEIPSGKEAGAHCVYSESSEGFAMTEGWAQFFELAVSDSSSGHGMNLAKNYYWMGADAYIRDPKGVRKDNYTGEVVEGAVATILWDLMLQDGFKTIWSAFNAANDSIWPPFYDQIGHSKPHQSIYLDNGIPVTDDGPGKNDYGQNDTLDTAYNIPIPWWSDHLIMAEKDEGAGDWFEIDLPKQEGEDRVYKVEAWIGFEADLGDMDIWAIVDGGEFVGELFGGTGNIVPIPDLHTTQSYKIDVVVVGHGVEPIGDLEPLWVGYGDFHPDYTLTISGGPPNPEPEKEDKSKLPIRGPIDPEEKWGPAGYDTPDTPAGGEKRFVSDSQTFTYRIEIWNDPSAQVPAQDARVYDILDPNIFDLSTVNFTRMGFLKWDIPLPGGQSIDTRVDTRPDMNIAVDITASLNPETGRIDWWFHTVDPMTGDYPEDPNAGFLPPFNPNTQYEIGWMEFTVKPKANLPSGTQVANQAFGQFDFQGPWGPAPKEGPWVNTIDAGAPSSTVLPLPAKTVEENFLVSWSGEDDTGGSGIASYDIYVSTDSEAYTLWQDDTTETSATYTGEFGHSYAFYSVAKDNIGHIEPVPSVPDSSTTLVPTILEERTVTLNPNQFILFNYVNGGEGSAYGILANTGDHSFIADLGYREGAILDDVVDIHLSSEKDGISQSVSEIILTNVGIPGLDDSFVGFEDTVNITLLTGLNFLPDPNPGDGNLQVQFGEQTFSLAQNGNFTELDDSNTTTMALNQTDEVKGHASNITGDIDAVHAGMVNFVEWNNYAGIDTRAAGDDLGDVMSDTWRISGDVEKIWLRNGSIFVPDGAEFETVGIAIQGRLEDLIVYGRVEDADIKVGEGIGYIGVGNDLRNSEIWSRTEIGEIHLAGNMEGSTVESLLGNIGILSIDGNMQGSSVFATRGIGEVGIGGSVDHSTLYATTGNIGNISISGTIVNTKIYAAIRIGNWEEVGNYSLDRSFIIGVKENEVKSDDWEIIIHTLDTNKKTAFPDQIVISSTEEYIKIKKSSSSITTRVVEAIPKTDESPFIVGIEVDGKGKFYFESNAEDIWSLGIADDGNKIDIAKISGISDYDWAAIDEIVNLSGKVEGVALAGEPSNIIAKGQIRNIKVDSIDEIVSIEADVRDIVAGSINGGIYAGRDILNIQAATYIDTLMAKRNVSNIKAGSEIWGIDAGGDLRDVTATYIGDAKAGKSIRDIKAGSIGKIQAQFGDIMNIFTDHDIESIWSAKNVKNIQVVDGLIDNIFANGGVSVIRATKLNSIFAKGDIKDISVTGNIDLLWGKNVNKISVENGGNIEEILAEMDIKDIKIDGGISGKIFAKRDVNKIIVKGNIHLIEAMRDAKTVSSQGNVEMIAHRDAVGIEGTGGIVYYGRKYSKISENLEVKPLE
jgi:hypothetical protein